MLENPKITVILPTYNGGQFLAQSVESIIAQTENDWELIIVNDCSTDNTLEIAEGFSAKDSRIQVITNRTNMKLPASLNIGFSKARGRYFTWTSDDNLYKPNALEIMAAYLDNRREVDFITANSDIIGEEGEVLKQKYNTADIRLPVELILGCNISAAFMYRREIAEAVGGYDENLFCAEDYDYWCRIALAGNIGYINDNIYQYRKHKNSLSTTKRKEAEKNKLLVQKKHLDAFCSKFCLSNIDRLKIAVINKSNVIESTPIKLYPLFIFLKGYKLAVKLIAGLVFWDKALRRKIRRRFSFSINSICKI
ncbi:MAG: glycosyltransferase family 2 protein [Deferribacteraceae bacterium]|jgi:glycosyltransferase involved in cell wall biosynthesis|nr:glycosyltransferase family 2 protein [Deferribacteraceae bacterium]